MGGFAQFFGVADTEKEAREIYREPAEYFFNRCLHVYAGFADPPGYKTVNTVRAGVEGMVERAAREATARADAKAAARAAGGGSGGAPAAGPAGGKPGMSFDEMIDKGYVIIGDPDQVAERTAELARSLNIGHLMALCHFGNMGKDLVLHNLDLMATKVLPQVRDLFEDEWENKWWPSPLPADRRAVTGNGASDAATRPS
jgi:alkanesulfonate monooxygenase SsuD/methylene tetrahydromethanopterin reductase-like flavin-dependent oxidoreductase (luciferase family)